MLHTGAVERDHVRLFSTLFENLFVADELNQDLESADSVEYVFRLQGWATLSMVAVSLVFLMRLWWKGELFGAQARLFYVWFVVAVALQLFAQSAGIWITGLLAQCILAIVLVLKDQIDSIS